MIFQMIIEENIQLTAKLSIQYQCKMYDANKALSLKRGLGLLTLNGQIYI